MRGWFLRIKNFFVYATGGWLVALIVALIFGGGLVIREIIISPRPNHQPHSSGSTLTTSLTPQQQQDLYERSRGIVHNGVLAGATPGSECISVFGVMSDYDGPYSCAYADIYGIKGFFPIFYAGAPRSPLSASPTSSQIRSAGISTCLYWAGQDAVGEAFVAYPTAANWNQAGRAVACVVGDDIQSEGESNIKVGDCVDGDGSIFVPWSQGDPCTEHWAGALTAYQVVTELDTTNAQNDDQTQCNADTANRGVVAQDLEQEPSQGGGDQQVLYAVCLGP